VLNSRRLDACIAIDFLTSPGARAGSSAAYRLASPPLKQAQKVTGFRRVCAAVGPTGLTIPGAGPGLVRPTRSNRGL
jgi:hypothetical protein